jgi:hypothetical protein
MTELESDSLLFSADSYSSSAEQLTQSSNGKHMIVDPVFMMPINLPMQHL